MIQRYLGDARGVSIDAGIQDPARPLENPDQTEMAGPTPRPSDTTLTLRAGDALLLCSDGLYNRISDDEIAAAATKYDPAKAVKSLIEQAVKRDEPDNITIVFWPTGGAPVAAAAVATRRPVVALALAAAGVVLALAAVWFIVGQSGGQQGAPPAGGESVALVPAASASAETAAAMQPPPDATSPPEQETETPTVAPSDTATAPATATALPTDTPSAQPTDAGALTIAPLPTTGSAGEAATPLPPTATPRVDAQSALGATSAAAAGAAAEAIASAIADPSQTAIATRTPGAGVRATSTPLSIPTVSPTPTATMTRTPQPSRTPQPATTGTAPTAAAAGSASGGVGGPRTATILSPATPEASSNKPTEFKWSTDRDLVTGQEFEVVFFNPQTETHDQGRSWVHSVTDFRIMIPADKAAPGTYGWALYLVSPQPYAKLRLLAGPFTFSIPGSGGEQKPENQPPSPDTDEPPPPPVVPNG